MKQIKSQRFNKIFLDILDWINRLLNFKAKKTKDRPYKIDETYKGTAGILKLVSRDTPRAVRTYIFTPFYIKDKNNFSNIVREHYDIHLCLDHLWAIYDPKVPIMKGVSRRQLSKKYTHCVTILLASRWMDKHGHYFTKPLLYKEFNFLGSSPTHIRDKYAVPIFDEVAHLLKNSYTPKTFDYEFELLSSQKRHLGAYYRKDEDLDDHQHHA